MQLISLSSNRDLFRSVHLKNEAGLNFIVAVQKNPELSDKGITTNGVGKSLNCILFILLGVKYKRQL